MPASVLVAYSTRFGSTQEVAEAVAEKLRERGVQTDIQHMRNVHTLEGYYAVVLGTAIYMSHFHKDARRFLSQHRKALTERPLGVFALGPVQDDQKEREGARAQFDQELAKFPWLSPVATAVFGGKFDPAKLRFPWNLVPVLNKLPAMDLRDWDAIRAWASDLAAKLQPALPSPSELAQVK